MQIEGQTVVVTGANRGLGRSLLAALLERGAAKVYATARNGSPVPANPRVVPLALDLSDRESIAAAARTAADATLLINNASTAAFAGPLDADRAALHAEMVVNYGGTFDVIRAFVPVLERNGGGAIVNVLSLLALASTPPMAGYSASKAAAHSLTQALRPVLKAKGISVHGVYPAGIDTDMLAGIDAPKAPPARVADGLLDGLAADQEDIFPDPNAQAMAETWWADPKSFERVFSGA
jgi:NAD(P)-dependent dehydrogenase (short-subunit alcohol dehydrogenase family)